MVYEVGVVCEICGIQEHKVVDYQTTFQGVELTNAMQNFNP